jgi:phospholipid/cholesterol/gamma-HCH transport system substrate-binding protein
MMVAIRKSLRDFIAVAVLIVIAAGITYYIFQEQRLRIPILEEKPFELKADFETAQAVVPGQGQTVRVAGVRVGDVSDVTLEDGVGVVTFQIDREFLPIYRDATLQMRPTTGLKDMFFQLDPGSKAAGEFEEGDTVPVSNTAPDVNLDEVLEALDSDTQAYLRLLLVGAGKGLDGRDKDLGQLLGGLGPINRDLRKLSSEVASRQQNVRNLVHNFNVLTGRVAQADDDLVQLVSTSNSALGAIAEQDPSVRRAVGLLGPTLSQAEDTLNQVAGLANVLGPTFADLTCAPGEPEPCPEKGDTSEGFADRLDATNTSLAQLGTEATPIVRDEIRPFVRAARKPIPDLRKAADRFSAGTPGLTVIGEKLNRLTNMAAYNPNGAEPVGAPNRDEGYLYWGAWLGHNGNLVFNTSDGNGGFRRIFFTAGCSQLLHIVTGGPGGLNPLDFGQAIRGIITGFGSLVPGFNGALFGPGGACT